MAERTVTMKGSPRTLAGEAPREGQPAPDFEAIGQDLQPVSLSSLKGKVLVIGAVPSLDTSVCDREMKRFNKEAAALGDGARVVCVSMDLPFAQKRWQEGCGAGDLLTLSDHRDAAFGRAYGVLIEDLRLLARSVFVVDKDGNLCHVQIVPEVTDEPDYDAALEAAKQAM